VVLAGALPRWLRVLGLVAGLVDAAMGTATTVLYGLGPWSAVQYVAPYRLGNVVYLLGLVPVLAGQARDARWSRGTRPSSTASPPRAADSRGSEASAHTARLHRLSGCSR
jgi:hypothetical protein